MSRETPPSRSRHNDVDRLALYLIAATVAALVFAIFVASRGVGSVPQSVQDTPLPASLQGVDASTEAPPPLALARPADRPLSVLYAGDSITAGAFAGEDSAAFRNIMTATIAGGGPVDASRSGDSGLTTEEVRPKIPDAVFDLVVVELGTNDVDNSTPEQFHSDYAAFLNDVRAQSPNAVLLCAGTWHYAENAPAFDVTIRSECEARGGRYVALRQLFAVESNRGPAGISIGDGAVTDDFHPNAAGHAAIAAALLGQLAL